MFDFFQSRRHLRFTPPVNNISVLRAEPFRTANRVHRRVAATDHSDILVPAIKNRRLKLTGPVRLHQIHSRQKFIRRINTAQIFTGHTEKLRQTSTGGNEHSAETFLIEKFIHRDRLPDDNIRFKLHTHPPHVFDFVADDVFRQPKFRNAINQNATDVVQCFEHRDRMTALD